MASHNLESLWAHFSYGIQLGIATELRLPRGLHDLIGDNGLQYLADRYRATIDGPVAITSDADGRFTIIMPASHPRGQMTSLPATSKAKPRTSNKAKVARPPNAFILYRQHHHPSVKARFPDLHNNQISVILGQQWKDEAPSDKASFIDLAKRLKIKHLQEHPGYQYQPRKPSEKKRRMSRRPTASKTTEFAATMADQSSTDIVDASDDHCQEEPSELTKVSGFSMTSGGNPTFMLGDTSMTDDAFGTMLNQYNDDFVAPDTSNLNPNILNTMYPGILTMPGVVPPVASAVSAGNPPVAAPVGVTSPTATFEQNQPVMHYELPQDAQDDLNFTNMALDDSEVDSAAAASESKNRRESDPSAYDLHNFNLNMIDDLEWEAWLRSPLLQLESFESQTAINDNAELERMSKLLDEAA